MLGISTYCHIKDNKVYRNGQLIFDGESLPLKDFLKAIYKHFGLKYPKFYKMDEISKLGFLASEIVLASNNFDIEMILKQLTKLEEVYGGIIHKIGNGNE